MAINPTHSTLGHFMHTFSIILATFQGCSGVTLQGLIKNTVIAAAKCHSSKSQAHANTMVCTHPLDSPDVACMT